MHYYQHHIGDFIKATARLTDSQAMAYLRLIWMYYDTERPLKPDTKLLAFQIGATVEETELLLESYFWLAENGWHHTRCDKEIAEYRAFLEKKSNAGRASAERRKNSSATGVEQVLNGCSTDVQLTTNHKPLTINHKPNKNKAVITAAPDGVSNDTWEAFVTLRRAKKAPVTKRALDGIRAEAQKAGWPLDAVMTEMAARGWTGFKASWVQEKQTASDERKNVLAALTRGLATPKTNFWEKPAPRLIGGSDVEG